MVAPSTSSIVFEDNGILFYSEQNLSASVQVKQFGIRGNLVHHVTLHVDTLIEQIFVKFLLYIGDSYYS